MLWHPFTGELIDPDDLPALEKAEEDLARYLSNLGPLYGQRRELRSAIASKRKLAGLPKPRYRTELQQAVSECPRCGGRHSPDDVVPAAEPNPFPPSE